jgi:hypothetical protein
MGQRAKEQKLITQHAKTLQEHAIKAGGVPMHEVKHELKTLNLSGRVGNTKQSAVQEGTI